MHFSFVKWTEKSQLFQTTLQKKPWHQNVSNAKSRNFFFTNAEFFLWIGIVWMPSAKILHAKFCWFVFGAMQSLYLWLVFGDRQAAAAERAGSKTFKFEVAVSNTIRSKVLLYQCLFYFFLFHFIKLLLCRVLVCVCETQLLLCPNSGLLKQK